MKIIEIKSLELVSPTQVTAKLTILGNSECIRVDVSENVSQHLTFDRIDAFVAGLLYFAMEIGCDIRSDIPLSQELYYHLEHHFIDTLAQDKRLYRTKIIAPLVTECKKTGEIIATGISCGVDSLYTIATHSDEALPAYKINSLAFFHVGSHETGRSTEESEKLYRGRLQLCRDFACEYGYMFFTVTSNIHKVIDKYLPYSHVSNHTYMTAFCVLMLQKGFDKYYYSSGHPYNHFRCQKSETEKELDSSHYDLLTLSVFSINNLRFYSAGAPYSRIEKTRLLCNYRPAQKYLNVCVSSSHNDGICFKCIRTLLTIDALGNIEDFGDVFDTAFYKAHREKYLQRLYIDARIRKDGLMQEILPFFRSEMNFFFKVRAVCSWFTTGVKNRVKCRKNTGTNTI